VTNATEGEGNSLWQTLRRRKVGQWGIAYVAGAWGLLQGLEYASNTLTGRASFSNSPRSLC
jgi:hypothetical protein